MEGGTPKPPSTPTGAVFLSYASEDVEAAKRICDALRVAGVEVWFDQSELRGGDAWDQSIRKQIKTCALFVPIISRHTHERAEGYFRLEWKLAVDRSHLITARKPFLVPVVVDDTQEDEEHVPETFREVKWMRLPAREIPAAFVARIQQLLSGEPGHASLEVRRPTVAPGRPPRSGLWLTLLAVEDAQFCLAMTYHKLGRYADAKEALAKIERLTGTSDAFRNAEIFAQWGATGEALDQLDTAMRSHDPHLERLKVSCLLDPIRGEPRFQALERTLKFPD
jgi:hypothetical protein